MRANIILLTVALSFVLIPYSAQAQSALYLEPATGVFPIGDPFTVDVRVDTDGSTIGTADISLQYDPDDVAFVSVSDEGSVLSRLIVDSGSSPGRIDVSGFIERNTPAYTGSNGLLARITFTPLRNVATEIRFSHGAATPPLLLNASVGDLANILTSLRSASYTFVPREVIPFAQVAGAATDATGSFPITPLPVPEGEWFGTTSIRLSWALPEEADEMRTVVTSGDEENEKIYPIPVSSVTLSELTEGKHFFVIQFKKDGQWGESTRFPLNIDMTPPDTMVVREVDKTAPSDSVSFVVEAHDALSGVSRFEVNVDGGVAVPWDGTGTFTPDVSGPGEHILTVTAIDAVGNRTAQDRLFFVRSLDAPILTYVPERVLTGDAVTVTGTTYPNSTITAFTSFDGKDADERTVSSDASGNFSITVTEGARAGTYTLWFQVESDDGVVSPPSIKRSFTVSQPYIMLWGGIAVTYLSVIVPLLALIILLGLVLWLGYVFVASHRKRIRRETTEAYEAVQEEFAHLRDDIRRQLGMLEQANQSRELTREEIKIFRELSKKLDYIERHIKQEIEDISALDHSKLRTVATLQRVSQDSAPPVVSTAPNDHTVRIERK